MKHFLDFSTSSKKRAIARPSAGFCSIAAAFIFAGGCTPPANTSSLDQPIAVADVAENHESLMGQTVTVRNDIQELISEVAFVLDADQVFRGEAVLVLNASKTPFSFPHGEESEVQVSGEVAQFVLSELEREYDLELDSQRYAKYENKPVIIAHSVVLSPDPGDVTQDPEAFYNREIAVAGEVEETIATGVFKLDEEQVFGGKDLLVITTKPEVEAQDDKIVVVTGVLRPFVLTEFEREYDLDWDLSIKEKIEAEYSNIPVLVSREVYASEE